MYKVQVQHHSLPNKNRPSWLTGRDGNRPDWLASVLHMHSYQWLKFWSISASIKMSFKRTMTFTCNLIRTVFGLKNVKKRRGSKTEASCKQKQAPHPPIWFVLETRMCLFSMVKTKISSFFRGIWKTLSWAFSKMSKIISDSFVFINILGNLRNPRGMWRPPGRKDLWRHWNLCS